MHLVDDLVHSAVTVGVYGIYLFVALKKHVVNAPCVNRHALDHGVLFKRDLKTGLDLVKQANGVPHEMAVLLVHTVIETVKLLGLNFSVLDPSDDVSAA